MLVAGGQVAQGLAELGVLETFLDLGAVAVEVFDPGGVLGVDVGEDEAVAVDLFELAVERQGELVGMDRLQPPRAAQPRDLGGAEADAPDDEPQRLVAPAVGRIARRGDLRAGLSVASLQACSGICASAFHIAVVRGTETVKRARSARSPSSSSTP